MNLSLTGLQPTLTTAAYARYARLAFELKENIASTPIHCHSIGTPLAHHWHTLSHRQSIVGNGLDTIDTTHSLHSWLFASELCWQSEWKMSWREMSVIGGTATSRTSTIERSISHSFGQCLRHWKAIIITESHSHSNDCLIGFQN